TEKPVRTTKVSGKHVVLPSESQLAPLPAEGDEEEAERPAYHTFERMAPNARTHTALPRLTSYAVGTDLHIPTLNGFLRREHGVRPRLYDECAYVAYFKPLLPGFGRANLRSSPEPRSGSPGAESRRERELEEREERGYVGSYFAASKDDQEESIDPEGYIQGGEGSGSGEGEPSHNHDTSPNMLTSRPILEALQLAELVVLPYGVVVFYNFTPSEERDIIEDVLSSGCVRGTLSPDDVETEAFHFCYDPTVPAPRIFNDFFTFRAPNHLLKLSLAHAVAQSTKLSVFEESMQRTLELTSHIPKELASSGELRLKRREALRLTGRLFKLRVDVNLTSNVLDTPELFWSEATLQALYDAIREYLEIDQRVGNLNDRLKVANDLLEIIHGHVAEEAMSKITVVIIALIVVACIVACGEITARLL
ncbi:DUF155-domain-containing protein, partial [Jaminaea rosea]